MEQKKIGLFLMNKGKLFPSDMFSYIGEQLTTVSNDKWERLWNAPYKSTTTAFLLTFFLGLFGGGQFYLNDTKKATGKLALLFVLGILISLLAINLDKNKNSGIVILIIIGCSLISCSILIWHITDLFRIIGITKRYNYNLLQTLIR